MYTKESLKSLLDKTAKRMTSIDFEGWEWPQGVGLYGLLRHYQETGNRETLACIIDWYESRFAEGLPGRNVNTTAPMLTLAHLHELTGNRKYLELCKEWAEWVMKDMPRTNDHGFQHIVTGFENPQQLWVDTLYMTVLFLAKMGMVLKRQDYVDESIRQFLVHIKYLYDKKTGLWFHGWTFIENCNFAGALWARGNCWVTAGLVDYIEMINLHGGVKDYLIDTLLAQVKGLEKLQDESGMWHTLLDDPWSYVETSSTAGFGYGILKAVRKGYIDQAYAKVGIKALEAVIKRIAEDGTVEQVSYGTGMGWDLDHYRKIPLCPMAYGQALAILLLNEGMKI